MDYYENVHKYWTERREILMATTLNVSQRVKDARCDADLTQTELGRKMLPIIDALAVFGNYYKSILEQQKD